MNKENRSEIHRDSHENISDNLDEKIFNRSIEKEVAQKGMQYNYQKFEPFA